MKKEIIIKKEKTEKILCNKCGNEIKKDFSGVFFDHLSVQKDWGYLSSLDGEKHSFEICESCYKEFVKSFKIPLTKD